MRWAPARPSRSATAKATPSQWARLTCRVEGGATDGGVLTGTTIYEWDKGVATLLSGLGVTRKPGATTAYQHTEGKQSLVMTDGKVTGATGSGRGRYTLATGAAAANNGKTYSYTFRTTAPGQFIVDVKNDSHGFAVIGCARREAPLAVCWPLITA